MPPVRTTSNIKPTTTQRTHAENQERAYIAASRRSDRSLEARVESARRASEIHKQRTGRSLRVREEDVLNEEMYEEEDDDMHWQYRRMGLIGNFPVNPELQRRFEAFTSFNMERANLLARAVANVNQNSPQSPQGQFPHQQQQQQQFMNPGMMQQGYQSPNMQPPKRTSSNYRSAPYPAQSGAPQQMRPSIHQRSASIATPQDPSMYQQHYPQSTQTPASMDSRRNSLPPSSQSHHLSPPAQRSNQVSPALSKKGTAALTPQSQTHSPQTMTPSEQSHQPQQSHTYPGPYNSHSNYSPEDDSPYGPLTTSLPMETQQILAGGVYPGYSDHQGTWAQDFQQPFYSYNPNSKASNRKADPSNSTGLDQTLMPTAIDTNVNSLSNQVMYDSPLSSNHDMMNSAISNPGYGLGFDLLNVDPFGGPNSSGQRTPAEDFMNQYVDGNMFAA